MKKIFGVAVVAALLGLSVPSYAQEKKEEGTVKKVGKKIKKGAKKAGNKTAELATKGKAKVTDKTSDVWEGPEGQTIYIDEGNKYYWVDKKGARHWVSKNELKPKKKDNEQH
jgi:co-chaperonin GroES (HSP10)